MPVEFNRSFDHSRSNVESLSSNCLRLVHGLLQVQALEVPAVREPVSTNAFGGFRRLYCMKEVSMGCQALMDFRNAHGTQGVAVLPVKIMVALHCSTQRHF